jgi:hypothetical protein
LKRRIALVTAVAAVMALMTSMVSGAASAAPMANAATGGTPTVASAVPKYYVALPGGTNFGTVPGSRTAVVDDTITGQRLLTVRPSGKDEFVTVSAAPDDTTFVLGANPDPDASLPGPPMPTDWYLVQLKPGRRLSATVRKLRIPAPAANGFADATALSPNGRDVALSGLTQFTGPQQPQEWVRIYSVATGALLRSWSGNLNVNFAAYTTLSWTSGGQSLAIGYTAFRLAAKKYWDYLDVRTLTLRSKGSNLVADSKLVWARLTRSTWYGSRTPLSCALDDRVLVSADGQVVCTAFGALRTYNPNQTAAPACPSVPPWASVGYLSFSTVTGKQSTLFQYDTSCDVSADVLWTSASGDAVIGYYALGVPTPGGSQTVRFGVFSHGTFSPLPVPPTTATVPQTIAW